MEPLIVVGAIGLLMAVVFVVQHKRASTRETGSSDGTSETTGSGGSNLVPPDSGTVAGLAKRILIVQPAPELDINYYAFIEQLAPSIGISYKHDVADDCEIRMLQDDANNWDPDKLKAQALADWPDQATQPGMFFDAFRGDSPLLGGSIWLMLVREPKSDNASSDYRYPEGYFPWQIQVSGLISEGKDAPFSSDELAALEQTLKSSDLEETTGYKLEMHRDNVGVGFGPVYVQFYDANELHGFWEKIEEWATRNKGEIYSRSPHKCTSCNHYTLSKYSACLLCDHEES